MTPSILGNGRRTTRANTICNNCGRRGTLEWIRASPPGGCRVRWYAQHRVDPAIRFGENWRRRLSHRGVSMAVPDGTKFCDNLSQELQLANPQKELPPQLVCSCELPSFGNKENRAWLRSPRSLQESSPIPNSRLPSGFQCVPGPASVPRNSIAVGYLECANS